MKKIVIPILFGTILLLSACNSSNKDVAENSSSSSTTISSVKKESKRDKDLPKEDSGNGNFYLSGPSGTTENGDTLTIFANKDTQLMQIGINSTDFDGSKLTYIYIDGKLVEKQQMSNSQGTINLEKDYLKKGNHIVNAVQYDDDSENGNIITNKNSTYEIKEK